MDSVCRTPLSKGRRVAAAAIAFSWFVLSARTLCNPYRMTFDLTDLARKGLQAELLRLDAERARIAALLAGLDGKSPRTAPAAMESTPRTRNMSPEGRQRIQEAVRRRWERVRAEQAKASGQTAGETAVGGGQESAGAEGTAPTARKGRATSKRSGGRKK